MNREDSLLNMHSEHSEWMNKLKFYRDDIKILNKRLAEIASKNNNKDVLAEIEKFQNQFIIQNDTIDRIEHEITIDEDKIKKVYNIDPVTIDYKKIHNHSDERESISSFEKNFSEIRIAFNKFSGKWM